MRPRKAFRIRVLRLLSVATGILLISLSQSISAQAPQRADTTVNLPDVVINAGRLIRPAAGEDRSSWSDSTMELYGGRSLDQLLIRESGAYIKSYGSGGIATISLRGSSSSQVGVTWNGVLLMNPMLGLQDFSLIPSTVLESASLTYGGSSARVGSGAIAGHLRLDSGSDMPTRFSVQLNSVAGSFGLWEESLKVAYGNGRFGGRTGYYHAVAANDFPYTVAPGKPERTLTHANVKRYGFTQDVFWRISQNDKLSGHVWWQSMDRDIPPTTVQNSSQAFQEDNTLRSVISWDHNMDVLDLRAKVAYFRDEIYYDDPLTLTSTRSIATTAMAEGLIDWSIDPNQKLTIGLSHYRLSGNTDAYREVRVQNRTALFIDQYHEFDRWSFQLAMREELIDGALSPFSMSFGANVDLLRWLTIHGKVSRDFRLPGINDLYWVPGGNPNLKPEKGWSEELGIEICPWPDSRDMTFGLTAFNRNISNWILWSLPPDENYWTASNITSVHSRGMEVTLGYDHDFDIFAVSLNGRYTLTHSTNNEDLQTPSIAAGEQLPYIPVHKATGSIAMSFKGIILNYIQVYNGEVTSDRADIIDSFTTGDIRLSYNLNFNKFILQPSFEVLNMWNEDYRVIQYRPMPGRNFRAGLVVNFNRI